MTSVSVLVIDDEPLARQRMLRILARLDGVDVAGEAGDVDEAQRLITALSPDILLLDIQMPGASGFDLIDRLGAAAPAIVFVTAFDHHALRAFDASAVDYVTKPVEPGRLAMAIARARSVVAGRRSDTQAAELRETVATLRAALRDRDGGSTDFWVKSLREHVRIPADRVIRIEAERDYVRIHADGRSYLFNESLASLEARLDAARFLRIHRSTIVRLDQITRLQQGRFGALIVGLSDGAEVRVGRTYAKSVRADLLGRA